MASIMLKDIDRGTRIRTAHRLAGELAKEKGGRETGWEALDEAITLVRLAMFPPADGDRVVVDDDAILLGLRRAS